MIPFMVICLGLSSVHAVHHKRNLAAGNPTKATSSYPGSAPANAVDGRNDTNWDSGSCFAVEERDQYPWWQVDLKGKCLVQEVDVIVRSDCCPERFHDVAVHVYENDPTANSETTAQLCHWFKGAASKPGETVHLKCPEGVKGRFVRLSGMAKKNSTDLLQFCEVMVHGDGPVEPAYNLAQGKPTKATSAHPGSAASLAVDGQDDSKWSSKSCFAVLGSDLYPWWQVDLEKTFTVTEVKVIVRSDCCPERFHNVAIEVYDADPTINPAARAKLCYWFRGEAVRRGGTYTLRCNDPVEGRYVRLSGKGKKNPNDLLQFCEVKVYGTI